MTGEENHLLEQAIDEITGIAKGYGLDFYPMRYEICPVDIIYTFGAYGMPTRYSHWSFGKTFHRMKLQYDLGLSKIYELVINSNPCYAFLLEGNSLIHNKLIVAHVLAHCDFFKNNIRFKRTSTDMVESMSASAERIRAYEMEHGKQEVEDFLDAALSIQEHIDPTVIRPPIQPRKPKSKKEKPKFEGPYDDLWSLDEEEKKRKAEQDKLSSERKSFPEHPDKDVLLFIEENSSDLDDWQRDILTMLREEMLYFWPQLETKIMNEGWASYWHKKILREMDLTQSESIEFAQLNASVVSPSKTSINPYYLGVKIFEDIEKRWNEPTEQEQVRLGRLPGKGLEKIFEVRETESDISFLRNYLTKQLVEDLDLYLFQKEGQEYKIVEKQWGGVREELVSMRVNGGFPYMAVIDGDYLHQGELQLKHYYEGIELDLKYIEKTLPHVFRLWGRPVHLRTVVEDKDVLFSFRGDKVKRSFL